MTDNFERALEERLLARSQVSSRDVEALRLFARTLPPRRSFWRGPALRWAMSAAAVVLAAVVAIPVITRLPGFGGTESPSPTAPATPVPSAPVVGPSTPASPSPTAPQPTQGAGTIRLRVASGSDVEVLIVDPDSVLAGAVAEQGAPTMSVRWFDSIVEAVDADSIRVTWVGFPKDEAVELTVDRTQSGVRLRFVQDAPPPLSDGLGEDRVMVFDFGEPIDPSDVEVTFDRPA